MDDTASVRASALARLEALVGDWTEQVNLPGTPAGRMSVEWILDGQFLIQRSQIPGPDFPDSVAVIAVTPNGTGYTQHYFDSRGVVRTYAMTLDEHTWTLLRDRWQHHHRHLGEQRRRRALAQRLRPHLHPHPHHGRRTGRPGREPDTMSSVRFEISMSLDGYVTASGARPDEPMGDGGQVLHEWAFGADERGRDVHADS